MSDDQKTQTAENGLPPERFDDPWDFTVTWSPERGALPSPVLRLFLRRSTIAPGKATKRTDKGHGTYYVKAVRDYCQKYHPARADIEATATRVIPPGSTVGGER